MKEYDPIQDKMDSLPFIVRDYLETIAEPFHDAQQQAENDFIVTNLGKSIEEDPLLNAALREYVLFERDVINQ